MNTYVEHYAEQGIKVFPCYPDKAPVTKNGFHDATKDIEELKKLFNRDDFLIGLPTGNVNGFIVIDFDIGKHIEIDGKKTAEIDPRTVEQLIEELEDMYNEKLTDTLTTETMSGGRHYYYALEVETSLSSGRRSFDKSLPIDIRANGGYVCGADGKQYTVYDDVDGLDIANMRERMAIAPEWILNLAKSSLKAISAPAPVDETRPVLPQSEVVELRAALAWIPSDDRDLWVEIGMALKYIGNGDSLKGLWHEWSMKAASYDPADIDKRWAKFKPRGDISFGSIVKYAQDLGFVSTYTRNDARKPEPAEPTISDEEIEERLASVVQVKTPFPVELLRPDGFMGEIIDYMNSQAIKSQPILSLAITLAFAGMLMGRKVETTTGIRSNLYIVGLGETGCGKENGRSIVKAMMQEFDKNKYRECCSVEDVTSDSSIYKALQGNLNQLFLIDEIGQFFNVTKNASASPYLYGIPKAFLKLFSDCNQITFGKTYVDSKNNIELNNPHLCIYGTANAKQFYDSLTKDNISDGLISRMLFFESDDPDPRKNEVVRMPIPQHIIDGIRQLFNMPTNVNPEGNVDAALKVCPLVVPKNENAKKMLDDFDEEIHLYRKSLREQKRIDVTYNRSGLTAEKIALVYAVTDDLKNPTPIITEKHMRYGIELTRYLMDQMQYVVEYHVWESEHERNTKRMLQLIRENKVVTMAELALSTQYLEGRKRDDILSTLLTCRLIEEEYAPAEPGQQKKKKVYMPIGR